MKDYIVVLCVFLNEFGNMSLKVRCGYVQGSGYTAPRNIFLPHIDYYELFFFGVSQQLR